MLSKSCVYGLRAVIYISSIKKDTFVSIRQISSKLDISFYFLTKILQVLTQKNILVSFKGPNGGVKLAKAFEQCILGLPGCGILNPCPLHNEWSQSIEILKTTFNNNTVAHLANKVRTEKLRISQLNYLSVFEDE